MTPAVQIPSRERDLSARTGYLQRTDIPMETRVSRLGTLTCRNVDFGTGGMRQWVSTPLYYQEEYNGVLE